jgi:hypothetical protein
MVAWVVMFSIDPRRATQCRHVTKIPSPQLLAFPALTDRDACNSFRIRSYEKCRVSPAFSSRNFKPYSTFLPTDRALCSLFSLFSLFAQRVFHNSFAITKIRALSKNSRGVPLLFPLWNSASHLHRLTPLSSADSINLHAAERRFRRLSRPHGGIP